MRMLWAQLCRDAGLIGAVFHVHLIRSVIGLLVFTIPFSVYMGYVESTHESHHENIVYPHMKCVTAFCAPCDFRTGSPVLLQEPRQEVPLDQRRVRPV